MRGPAKFAPVETYPLLMTDAELRDLLGSLANSEVMRTLLVAEVAAIRAGAEREERTMRGMWYDYIKPCLSRARLLDKTTRNGKETDWARLLSSYLAEMVRDGGTTYEELRIVDGSRQRQVAVSIVRPMADVELVGPHYPWLILFTEKDTIWNVVETVASLYGVSAISGGGEPSAACTENTVKAIQASETYHGEPLTLLALTDYDPYGYVIAQSQFDQITEAVKGRAPVFFERLGLQPGQLTPEERRAKAYKPKADGLEAWYAETGGVDGQILGLELDALPLSRLRRMFADGIEKHIDLELRRADLRESFVDLLAWEMLGSELEAKRRAMLAAVKRNGLWQHILDTPIPGNLFSLAAVAGLQSIDPTDGNIPLFDCAERVRAAMRDTLAGGDR
jgi:hypothetical protein